MSKPRTIYLTTSWVYVLGMFFGGVHLTTMPTLGAASNSGKVAGGFDPLSLAPAALIFVVLYFFVIRPQNKKAQEHKNMLSKLVKGDVVLFGNGIKGRIDGVDEGGFITVLIAEQVRIHLLKDSVVRVLEDKKFLKNPAPEVFAVSKKSSKKLSNS